MLLAEKNETTEGNRKKEREKLCKKRSEKKMIIRGICLLK